MRPWAHIVESESLGIRKEKRAHDTADGMNLSQEDDPNVRVVVTETQDRLSSSEYRP